MSKRIEYLISVLELTRINKDHSFGYPHTAFYFTDVLPKSSERYFDLVHDHGADTWRARKYTLAEDGYFDWVELPQPFMRTLKALSFLSELAVGRDAA
jgi:hypothetical protein